MDDGGGFVENGAELHVFEAFVERRLHGMKGLQWGMDGVVIGFSDLPAEGVLRAKVIVGNDDASSDYGEDMPAVSCATMMAPIPLRTACEGDSVDRRSSR